MNAAIANQTSRAKRRTLDVDEIIEAAVELIEQEGEGGLSMRRLGASLGVDPMAVYHHVGNREQLIALALEHVLAGVPPIAGTGPWRPQVRSWARHYRATVIAHRSLTYEALRSPSAITEVAVSATDTVVEAIRRSGATKRRASEYADLLVDYIHGHALAVTAAADTPANLRGFDRAIDTILDGIEHAHA